MTHTFKFLKEYLDDCISDFERYELYVLKIENENEWVNVTVKGSPHDIKTMIRFFNGTEYI